MAISDYYIQDNSDIENRKLEAAKGLYQTGNYAGALKLYLDMVNTSYSYKLYYEIGRCYYKLNDMINAELHFTRSVELEENKNPSYVFLGNIFYKRGDAKNAIEYWMRAFSFKPDDESVCLNLATSYFSKNMKFQSILYYEKYLKYAKDKSADYYLEIKKSIDGFKKISDECYAKAQKSISLKDTETAIQALEYSLKHYPVSFDSNYLLGRLYFDNKQYMQALIYLKQAYAIDNKSLDVLEKLSATMIILGDFTGAYCVLKRTIPLVLNNQKEYLNIVKTLKQLENGFNSFSSTGHKDWAIKYLDENNYHLALFEYENVSLIENTIDDDLRKIIDRLKTYLKPEEKIITTCMEKGGYSYSNGDYRLSNKYFTKVMTLANENTSEYRIAKSRIVNA